MPLLATLAYLFCNTNLIKVWVWFMFALQTVERFGCFLILLLLVACQAAQAQDPPVVESVVVTRNVVETVPTALVPECTPLPADMTLEIRPLSSQSVTILMTGLQPGEQVRLRFDRVGEAGEVISDLVIEQGPSDPISDNGRLETTQSGLEAREDGLNRWAVQVIHARGVACTTVDL